MLTCRRSNREDRFRRGFEPVNALLVAGDEVHHSVWCLLDVPHLASLFRLCRGRPRPCSRRLPARGAVFVFWSKYTNFVFVRLLVDTYRYLYQSDIFYVGKRRVVKIFSSVHSRRARGRGFDSRSALFLLVGVPFVVSCLFVRHRGVCE